MEWNFQVLEIQFSAFFFMRETIQESVSSSKTIVRPTKLSFAFRTLLIIYGHFYGDRCKFCGISSPFET